MKTAPSEASLSRNGVFTLPLPAKPTESARRVSMVTTMTSGFSAAGARTVPSRSWQERNDAVRRRSARRRVGIAARKSAAEAVHSRASGREGLGGAPNLIRDACVALAFPLITEEHATDTVNAGRSARVVETPIEARATVGAKADRGVAEDEVTRLRRRRKREHARHQSDHKGDHP